MPKHKAIVTFDKRPDSEVSWESLLKCAQWELARAIEASDLKRIEDLNNSIRFAQARVEAGDRPWASTQN